MLICRLHATVAERVAPTAGNNFHREVVIHIAPSLLLRGGRHELQEQGRGWGGDRGHGHHRGRGHRGPNSGGGRGRGRGGGGQGPPPGLTGRDIGMFYAKKSKQKKQDREKHSVSS